MNSPNSLTVFDRLQAKLSEAGISFEVLRHAPVYTSEEAAAIRGVPLASGAKALVCKVDDRFVLFVLPADRKLDSKAARRAMSAGSLRFATREEVFAITQLTPGSIPPFGSLFDLETVCDPGLREADRINFNAGDHCISVSLSFDDYLAVEQSRLVAITG